MGSVRARAGRARIGWAVVLGVTIVGCYRSHERPRDAGSGPADAPPMRDGGTDASTDGGSPDACLSGPPQRLTDGEGEVEDVVLAATSDGFLVAWTQARDGTQEVYVRALDARGGPQGPARALSRLDGSNSQTPSIASGGGEALVAWEDAALSPRAMEIVALRVGADGAPRGAEIRLTSDEDVSENPSVAWSEDRWAVAWEACPAGRCARVDLAILSPRGTVLGLETVVEGSLSREPEIVGAPGGFALAWVEDLGMPDYRCHFARTDLAGRPPEPPARVSEGAEPAQSCSVVGTEAGYDVLWTQTPGAGQAWHARLDTAGRAVRPHVALPLEGGLRAAAHGAGIAVTYLDVIDRRETLLLALFDGAGAPIAAPRRIIGPPGAPRLGHVAARGRTIAVAWLERLERPVEDVWVATLCP